MIAARGFDEDEDKIDVKVTLASRTERIKYKIRQCYYCICKLFFDIFILLAAVHYIFSGMILEAIGCFILVELREFKRDMEKAGKHTNIRVFQEPFQPKGK